MEESSLIERSYISDHTKSKEHFRTTFEHAAFGIAHIGLDKRWLIFNQKLCDILGYTCKELQQKNFFTVISKEDFQDTLNHAEMLPTSDVLAFSGERQYVRQDGTTLWINLTISTIHNQASIPQYFIAVIEDITERKQVELAQSEAKLRMEEFLCIASHELKAPLTTINMNIQVAERLLTKLEIDNTDEMRNKYKAIQEMLKCATSQVEMLSRQINDLIDISRIQANKLELHMRMEYCDLAVIIQEVIQNQRQIELTRDIRLSMSCLKPGTIPLKEEALIPVLADPGRIGQVITNYLTNALKYSPNASPVEAHLQVEGDIARVSIRDHGQGLSFEEQKHIWERFYQAQGTEVHNNSYAGLGLGLHICRSIIEQHQGRVGVQSVPGHGSTFWFTLPLAQPED